MDKSMDENSQNEKLNEYMEIMEQMHKKIEKYQTADTEK